MKEDGKFCEECGSETLLLNRGTRYCSRCNRDIKQFVICQNCGQREGTENWVGEGGTMAFIHGMHQCWCKICCCEAQLEYARKLAATIPELEVKLAALKEKE